MRPSSPRPLRTASLFLLLPLWTGCITATPGLHSISHKLERELGDVRFESKAGIKLGRLSMLLTRSIAGMALGEDEEDRLAGEILRGLRKVEVASYRAVSAPGGGFSSHRDRDFDASLHRSGWQILARVQEDDEAIWVAYREEEEEIRRLLVVVVEEQEMELIRISGHLDQTLRAALKLALREWNEESDPDSPDDLEAPNPPTAETVPIAG